MLRAQTHHLSNGLPVLFYPQERLHAVELGLYVKGGPRFESAITNGISHFTEHMLFRGTEHYSTFDLHTRIETMGGPVAALTGRDHATYYLQVPARHLEEAINLFAELFLRPTFADLEVERPIILEERLEDLSDRGDDLHPESHCRQLLWPGSTLAQSILGSEANIRRFGAADLQAHHQRTYNASNALLYLAGPVDARAVLPTIQAAMGVMPAGVPLGMEPARALEGGPRIRFVDHEASQDSLMLSFAAPSLSSADRLPLTLLHMALADGMTSRLQWTICERLGLVYDVDASLDCYADVGALDVTSLCGPGKIVPLLRAVLGVLDDLRRTPLGATELAKVKERFAIGLELGLDGAGALASRMAGEALYGIDGDGLDPEAARRITAADIQRVAASTLRRENLVLVVVGRPNKRERRTLTEMIDGAWSL